MKVRPGSGISALQNGEGVNVQVKPNARLYGEHEGTFRWNGWHFTSIHLADIWKILGPLSGGIAVGLIAKTDGGWQAMTNEECSLPEWRNLPAFEDAAAIVASLAHLPATPPAGILAQPLTREIVRAWPYYYIDGPGREQAEQTNCPHGNWLAGRCVMCDYEEER